MGDGDKDDKDGGMGTSGEIRRKELEKASQTEQERLQRLREAARQREEEERRRKGQK